MRRRRSGCGAGWTRGRLGSAWARAGLQARGRRARRRRGSRTPGESSKKGSAAGRRRGGSRVCRGGGRAHEEAHGLQQADGRDGGGHDEKEAAGYGGAGQPNGLAGPLKAKEEGEEENAADPPTPIWPSVLVLVFSLFVASCHVLRCCFGVLAVPALAKSRLCRAGRFKVPLVPGRGTYNPRLHQQLVVTISHDMRGNVLASTNCHNKAPSSIPGPCLGRNVRNGHLCCRAGWSLRGFWPL